MTNSVSYWSDDELQIRLDMLDAARTRKYQQLAYSLDSPEREAARQEVEEIERHIAEINQEISRRIEFS